MHVNSDIWAQANQSENRSHNTNELWDLALMKQMNQQYVANQSPNDVQNEADWQLNHD